MQLSPNVIACIDRYFPEAEREEVAGLLAGYGEGSSEKGAERIHLLILKMSRRDVRRIRSRLNRLGAPAAASLSVDAGETGGSDSLLFSRPCFVNRNRRSTSEHPEHMYVWCSKPGTGIVLSSTTFIRIISAPRAIQRIASTHSNAHWHSIDDFDRKCISM